VWHEDVRGKAPINRDAEMARRGADILLTHTARDALPATDPRVDCDLGAGLHVCVGAYALNEPGDLVTKCEGQSSSGLDVEFLAAAQQEVSILHVQVRMTDAATLDPHKDFGSLRPRYFDNRLA
jgi:hypothetical protein